MTNLNHLTECLVYKMKTDIKALKIRAYFAFVWVVISGTLLLLKCLGLLRNIDFSSMIIITIGFFAVFVAVEAILTLLIYLIHLLGFISFKIASASSEEKIKKEIEDEMKSKEAVE